MRRLSAIAVATALGFTLAVAQEAPQDGKENTQPKAEQKAEQKAARRKRQADPQARQANRRAKMIAKRTQRINEGAAEILAAYDKDKNGSLSEQEKADMMASFEKARKTFVLANRYKMIQKIDADGDLVVTEEEMEAQFDQLQQMHQNRRNNGQRPMRGAQRGQREN